MKHKKYSNFSGRDVATYIEIWGLAIVGYGYGGVRGRAPGKYMQWHPFYIVDIPLYEHRWNIKRKLHLMKSHFSNLKGQFSETYIVDIPLYEHRWNLKRKLHLMKRHFSTLKGQFSETYIVDIPFYEHRWNLKKNFICRKGTSLL